MKPSCVTDSLGANLNGLPDAFSTGHFPGVTGQSKAGVFCSPVQLLKPEGGSALLVSADSNRDNTVASVFFRNIEDAFNRKFQRDMPGEARRYLHLAEQVIRSSEQDLRSDTSREGLRS